MKGLNSQNDEWDSVVKAQHLAIQKQENEEKIYSQLNKVKYREELDQQLKIMERFNQNNEEMKRKEFEFHQMQGVRFKEFDNRIRKEQRDYCKSFIDKNAEVIEFRKKENELRFRQEKGNMEEMVRKLNNEIEAEKRIQSEKRQKRIIDQKSELDRLHQESQAKKHFQELEKQREREMVSKKITEMQKNENNFQQFYDQKLKQHEAKLRKISPHFSTPDPKQVLIQKRLLEYSESSSHKQREKEKSEQIRKIESIKLIKQGLDDQLHSKKSAASLERIEAKKYQDIFKKQALEEEYYKNLNQFTRNLEKMKVKEEYDKQVLEKRSASMAKMRMNEREKEIHSKMLENIEGHTVFPCVPGLHSSQSPSKASFDNIYSKQRLKREVERLDAGKNIKFAEGNNESYWNQLAGHNPITNPIGATVPKVPPGQRLGRGVRNNVNDTVGVKDLISGGNF